jgi:hypothetical protein
MLIVVLERQKVSGVVSTSFEAADDGFQRDLGTVYAVVGVLFGWVAYLVEAEQVC